METSKEIQMMLSCDLQRLESLWVHEVCIHTPISAIMNVFLYFRKKLFQISLIFKMFAEEHGNGIHTF